VHQRTQCINALRGHLRVRPRFSTRRHACRHPGCEDQGSGVLLATERAGDLAGVG
jgi:hypothetical protein